MATQNYDPNARYDHGPNAAGTGRTSDQARLQAATPFAGLQNDGTVNGAELRIGQNAAGIPRDPTRFGLNSGPNVAGAPRSYSDT